MTHALDLFIPQIKVMNFGEFVTCVSNDENYVILYENNLYKHNMNREVAVCKY